MSFLALFEALEWNENIFSAHKQSVRRGMRWPAVPPFVVKNQSLRAHIKNQSEYAFPRKRSFVPLSAQGVQSPAMKNHVDYCLSK
jgi:hypothetical protein